MQRSICEWWKYFSAALLDTPIRLWPTNAQTARTRRGLRRCQRWQLPRLPDHRSSGWKNADTNADQLTNLSALSFVPFLVIAHYDESEAVAVSVGADSTTLPIVALRDGQAVQVVDDTVRFIGEGEPVAFNGFAEQYLTA